MSDARAELLAKAVAYYAAHGVRDTSLRTLAAAIGTSQRMLNYHFGSRTDLLSAVIDAIAGAQAAQIGELFTNTSDPLVAARANWSATVDGALTYGALWYELAAHAMHGEPYARQLGEVMVDAQVREFTRVYATQVDEARAERLARLTLAVGQGLLFDLLIDGDREGADAAIDEFITLVGPLLSPASAEPHGDEAS